LLIGANRQRLGYDEADTARARTRIHEALQRLEAGLRTLDPQLLHHVSSIVERTEEDVRDTKAGVEYLHIRENTKDRIVEAQRILNWICPSKIDYADQQKALGKRRRTNIGQWFLDSNEYRSWIRGDRATLLCSGKPGAGKTMTTSSVISDILAKYNDHDQIGVAYIYCQYSRHEEQTPEYLMSSILRQLIERYSIITDKVQMLFNRSRGEEALTIDGVSDLLNHVLTLFDKSIIIIDALDELRSTDCNGLVTQVLAIQQSFNINLFATSRYIDEIAGEALNAAQIDIRAREEDLRRSLDIILRRGILLKKESDLREQALLMILHLADGVYVPKDSLRYQLCVMCTHTDVVVVFFWRYSMLSIWLVCIYKATSLKLSIAFSQYLIHMMIFTRVRCEDYKRAKLEARIWL